MIRARKSWIVLPALAGVLMPDTAMAQPGGAPPLPPAAAAAAAANAPKPAAANPRADADYVIGSDDVIEVDLLGQADFRTRARITTEGTMALPFLGTVNVSGKTRTALARDIEDRLKAGGYFSKPVINIEIVSYASRYVIVLGDVGAPGLVPVDRAYRLSEVMARVGGIRAGGADFVVLTREGQKQQNIPFNTLAKGVADEDPYVEPGDKIFVPQADVFYIYGQINAPGVFPIADGMTLRRALARAGGLTPSGSPKRVKVYRNGQETKLTLDDPIRKDDVLVVGERLF